MYERPTDHSLRVPGLPNESVGIVGYGFIGRRIARLACERGSRVSILTRSGPGGDGVVIGDAADAATVGGFTEGLDHVVFAAGSAKPAESDMDPAGEVSKSLGPLLAVLEAVARNRVPRFTYLSSGGTVYGRTTGLASEETDQWPITTYGVLKLAAERFVALYARQHGFSADVLRCSNVYGPGQPSDGSQGVIGVFLGALKRGSGIRIYGDGSALRDFIHVDDLADVVLRLAEIQGGVRVLNVGSGSAVSIGAIAGLVIEAMAVNDAIEFLPPRPSDVPTVVLDITKLRSLIEFTPRSLKQGLLALAEGYTMTRGA